jgi:hypothetical protein
VDNLEKVLDALGDDGPLHDRLERQPEGKIESRQGLGTEKMILKGSGSRRAEGRLHVARKVRSHDERDPSVESYAA